MPGRHLYVAGIPYRIDEEIGHGLHSIVYGGYDLRDGQPVAVKVIDFTPGLLMSKANTESRQQSYWKEIEMLLYLQELNPYIIRVFNYDQTDQHGIIVMERGATFRDVLIRFLMSGTPMPSYLIKTFWSQMVEAVYYMHSIGVVHGDCKPENFIQVSPDGTNLRLIDMGISFQLPPYVTSHLQTAAGTPDYVSPEMVNSCAGLYDQSTYGYKADIWALGVILFEMAFGFRPLQSLGDNARKINYLGRLQRDIYIPDHPDKQLRDILKRCLRSDPHLRPNTEQILNHPFVTRIY